MRYAFPLFQTHLDLAHSYWANLVEAGDIVIDATCGNGNDTLALCKLALAKDKGIVYAFDIQEEAIFSTHKLLSIHLAEILHARVQYRNVCHSQFTDDISPESVKLIVYNLGYLPRSDKNKTTKLTTTLESLQRAQILIKSGGVISITCYPGHTEGAKELESILIYASSLSPKEWSCCHHQWLNREKSPTLLLLQKAIESGNLR